MGDAPDTVLTGGRHCGACSTRVLYREIRDPATMAINVGSLDQPLVAGPALHVGTASCLAANIGPSKHSAY